MDAGDGRHAGASFEAFRIYAYILCNRHVQVKSVMKPSRVRPLSHLKSRAAEMIRNITESREPMVITQNGEAKVVVQDVQSYEDLQQTLALLKILAMGQKNIEAGQWLSAEDVFMEIDRLDKEDSVK